MGVAVPVFDDDYITMDPLYVEPPIEDDVDGNAVSTKANKSMSFGPVHLVTLPPIRLLLTLIKPHCLQLGLY